MSDYDLVDTITCTTRAYEPKYIFQIELSDLAIDQLKYKTLLGFFRLQKHESQFLSDLADTLCAEVLQKLKVMLDNQEARK